MDFSGSATYIHFMLRRPQLGFAIALAGLAVGPASAQRASVAIDQITVRSAPSTSLRIAPVRGVKSSAPEAEPKVDPAILEACRQAQADDRRAPEGVDCLAARQAQAAAAPLSAEGALLPLFGQSGDVTGTATSQIAPATNADAVARQLSTGDIQAGIANGAAAVAGRERAPPPSNPPR